MFMTHNYILGEVTNKEGRFTVRGKNPDWVFTDDVTVVNDGTIIWWTQVPKGVLIQYPDKTKRFINDSMLHDF